MVLRLIQGLHADTSRRCVSNARNQRSQRSEVKDFKTVGCGLQSLASPLRKLLENGNIEQGTMIIEH